MALRLRRGTDAERLLITPADGEMIWTTDTQELYVGNGTTVGGIRITGALNDSPESLTRNLDLDSNTIFGSGDINISGQITTSGSITATGTVTAGSLVGDGSQIYNLSAANLDVSDLVVEGGAYYLNIVGPDSASVLDTQASELNIDSITGTSIRLSEDADIGGSVTANQFYGDLIGEVNSEDSTIVIDRFGNLFTEEITADFLKFKRSDTATNNVQIEGNDNSSGLFLTRISPSGSGFPDLLGRVNFDDDNLDTQTRTTYAFISASPYGMFLSADQTGIHAGDKVTNFVNGAIGIGGLPTTDYKLAVFGDINVDEGKLTLGQVEPSEVTSPSAGDVVYSPGADRVFFREGSTWKFPLTVGESDVYLANTLPIQASNYSTIQIGLGLTGAEQTGVLLFNTTTKQLQVYNNGWKNIASDGGVFVGDHQGSVGLDDSTTVIDGTDGKITAPNTVTFASFSTVERDALGVVTGGTVIFNSTTAKLQVYNGSTWLDLH